MFECQRVLFRQTLGFLLRFVIFPAIFHDRLDGGHHVFEFADSREVGLQCRRLTQQRLGHSQLLAGGGQPGLDGRPLSCGVLALQERIDLFLRARLRRLGLLNPIANEQTIEIADLGHRRRLIRQDFELRLVNQLFVVGLVVEFLKSFEVDDARQHLRAATRFAVEQFLRLALQQQHRRCERVVIQADLLANPQVEIDLLVRVRHRQPAIVFVRRHFLAEDLLRPRCRATRTAL